MLSHPQTRKARRVFPRNIQVRKCPVWFAWDRLPWSSSTMQLDWRVCSRARLARDTRFDGKFFIGVLTTKIYCRPICRSRTSKESNVRYFPSAAAAAEAGFRPCLRCHPEYSPGAPVWAGTQNTVTRALRLISETGTRGGRSRRTRRASGRWIATSSPLVSPSPGSVPHCGSPYATRAVCQETHR